MSGRDPINPLFIGYFRQKFPLQLIIAEGTGNGGMPRQIFIYKVTDNAFTEEFPCIVCNMLNTQPSCQRPCIFQIFRFSTHFVKTESDSRYFIAGFL